MKTIMNASFLILLLAVTLTSCAQKSNGKKVTNNYITNPITDSNGNGVPDVDEGGGTVEGCDGVYKNGATRCYYSNLPKIVVSGTGAAGTYYWQSNNLGSGWDQNQFRSDGRVAVRIKAIDYSPNDRSVQGRICGQYKHKYDKIKVSLMVRGTSMTEPQDFIASAGGYSNKVYFDVPGGVDAPFIIEVHSVFTDQACKMGSLQGDMVAGCPAKTWYGKIPLQTDTAFDTFCAAFKIEYATDTTYGLPN